MMMKKIVLIALIFICLNASAQKHLIGLKSGVNFSNIYDQESGANFDYQTGLSAGLTYEILFKKHFSLGLDFIYNERGFNKTSTYPITNLPSTIPYRKISESYINNYYSVPIKVGYTFGKKIVGFVNLGISTSFLSSSNYSAIAFDKGANPPSSNTADIASGSKIDLAIQSEAGLGFKLSNIYYIYTAVSNQSFLFPIYNPDNRNGEIKYYGYTFSAGMKFIIGKQKI